MTKASATPLKRKASEAFANKWLHNRAAALALIVIGLVGGSMASSAIATPSEFPIPRLKGAFTYHQNFRVPQIRRAETINVQSSVGQKREQALRSDGYTCIRKNQDTRLCSKVWAPEKLPEGFDKSVEKFMARISVEFSGTDIAPVLVHDGSTTQEWDVKEPVKVIDNEVGVYRVVKTNKNQIFVVFPVTETQPLGPLLFYDATKLSLSVIASAKDTETSTLAYTIEGFLETSR